MDGGSWSQDDQDHERGGVDAFVGSKPGPVRTAVCPACETGGLVREGGLARCTDCGQALGTAVLETLREIASLPDAVGHHPCECGHPEMRLLPGAVFHCPACRSEVSPPSSVSL